MMFYLSYIGSSTSYEHIYITTTKFPSSNSNISFEEDTVS